MKDLVKCCNCTFVGLVEVGEESCPDCKHAGMLSWFDDKTMVEDDFDISSIYNTDIKKQSRVLELKEAIYYENYAGGALHIVLDDGNVKDSDINWCLENTISEMEDGPEKRMYTECAELLLKLPIELR